MIEDFLCFFNFSKKIAEPVIKFAVPDSDTFIIFNMYTGGSEYRIIEGTESIEVLRVHFGGTVAAHQVVFEEDADFGYDGLSVGVAVGGYFDAGQQVFLAVCAEHANGQLRAG